MSDPNVFCDFIGAPCPYIGLYFDCWDCYPRQELAEVYDDPHDE